MPTNTAPKPTETKFTKITLKLPKKIANYLANGKIRGRFFIVVGYNNSKETIIRTNCYRKNVTPSDTILALKDIIAELEKKPEESV